MQLMTKAITQAAQKQYALGSNVNDQKAVAKFFDPTGSWTWYLMNQDPTNPDYLWGIVTGQDADFGKFTIPGSFSLSELQAHRGHWGLGIERDRHFRPRPAHEIYAALLAGQHI